MPIAALADLTGCRDDKEKPGGHAFRMRIVASINLALPTPGATVPAEGRLT
jgi:hypothetical protein